MLTHGAAIKTTLPSDAKLIGLDLAAYESRSSIVVSIIPKLVLLQGVSKGPEITINGWIYEHKYFPGGAQFLPTLKDGASLGNEVNTKLDKYQSCPYYVEKAWVPQEPIESWKNSMSHWFQKSRTHTWTIARELAPSSRQ
jgi:hypothetical protein